jgi:hypothetical protein
VATLADLAAGQAFMFLSVVTSIDTAGTHLSLFGPASAAGGNALIAPDGSMTGQLTSPPAQIPVTLASQFTAVSAGDVLANNRTGETMVVRTVAVASDGSYRWSPAPSGGVVYTTVDWTTVGHVDL